MSFGLQKKTTKIQVLFWKVLRKSLKPVKIKYCRRFIVIHSHLQWMMVVIGLSTPLKGGELELKQKKHLQGAITF